MKQRILAMFICLCMVITLLPAQALAADGGIASEADLAAAIDAAPDGVPTRIILTGDITLTDTLTIPAGKDILLDLKEYGITNGSTGLPALSVEARATLELTGSTGSVTGGDGGPYRPGSYSVGGDGVINSGTLYLSGGSVKGGDDVGYGITNSGTLYLSGGSVKGGVSGDVGVGGVGVINSGTLYLSGGSVTGGGSGVGGVGVINSGTLYLSGGSVTGGGGNGLGVSDGTVYLSGGSVTSISDAGLGVSGGTVYLSGGSVTSDVNLGLGVIVGMVYLSGGSFKGNDSIWSDSTPVKDFLLAGYGYFKGTTDENITLTGEEIALRTTVDYDYTVTVKPTSDNPPPAPGIEIHMVQVDGMSTLARGDSARYTATVDGSAPGGGNVPKAVTWEVSGNTSTDTKITQGGALLVGADETAKFLAVTATSLYDDEKTAELTVNISLNYDLKKSPLTLSGSDGCTREAPHVVTYTGGGANGIKVTSGTHFVELQDVNIDTSNGSPIDITPSAALDLTISGTNSLIAQTDHAGIHVPVGAELTLRAKTGDSDTLTADANGGDWGGAGIGGNNQGESAGTVTIHSGTITAIGGGNAASIGGGAGYGQTKTGGNGGTMIIHGGMVNAQGVVGGGNGNRGVNGGNGGTVTIHGGTVNAPGVGGGGDGGGGENGGNGGSGGTVTIHGGTVNAQGGVGGGGGGGGGGHASDHVGGNGGSGGTVTIRGGTVNAQGGVGGGGVGGGAASGGSGGSGGTVIINGGTANAQGGIGGGGGGGSGSGLYYDGSDGAPGTVTNGKDDVLLHTLTVGDPIAASTAFNSLDYDGVKTYGMTDVSTDANGKLYVYLPGQVNKIATTNPTGTYSGDVQTDQDTRAKTALLTLPVATVPTAPQNLTATAGNGQAVLSWSAPTSDGGAAITAYEVSSDGGKAWVSASSSVGHTFTGLVNGTKYTFSVRAKNSVGSGPAATADATPTAPGSSGGSTSGGGSDPAPSDTDKAVSGIQNAKPGDTVRLDIGSGGKLDGKVLDALAGKDVTLEVKTGGVTWVIRGKELPTGQKFAALNLSVNTKANTIPVTVINNVTGARRVMQLSLGHDGPFGFPLTLRLDAGKENAGLWANLYYYHPEKQELEFRSAAKIGADGQTDLPFDHASDYAVVIDRRNLGEPVFTDTANHWAKDSIDFVAARGILTGTAADQFSPDTGMTRGMFVTALYRLAGSPQAAGEGAAFTDIPAGAYYADAVRWAYGAGITGGTTATTFSPDKIITRQELAALMANYAGAMGCTLPETREAVTFADGASIASWAKDAVTAMQMAGVMNGRDGNKFDPTGTATRAEVAAVLHRFVALVIDPATA